MKAQVLSEEHDDLLLSSPWLGKKDQHGKTHLCKYISIDEGRSFVFLTTDLAQIHIHTPQSTEITSALWDSTHPYLQLSQELVQSSEIEENDDQVVFVVQRLDEMFDAPSAGGGGRWDEVQLLLETGADDGQVMYLKTDHFGWRVPLSPLRPSAQLSFISRHLLAPLTTLVAQDRSIPAPNSTSSSPFDGPAKLIADPEISRAVRRISAANQVARAASSTSALTPASAPATSSNSALTINLGKDQEAGSDTGSPTPRKPSRVANTHNLRKTHIERSPSPAPASAIATAPTSAQKETKRQARSSPHTSSSMAPPSDRSSSQLRSSPPPAPSSSLPPATSTPVGSSPPLGGPTHANKRSKMYSHATTRNETERDKGGGRLRDMQMEADVPSSSPSIGSAMDFKPPTQTRDRPSQSQKTKREREKEEEEEVERKMKEVRKRMESGKGSKLGKRRLAR